MREARSTRPQLPNLAFYIVRQAVTQTFLLAIILAMIVVAIFFILLGVLAYSPIVILVAIRNWYRDTIEDFYDDYEGIRRAQQLWDEHHGRSS